MELKEMVVLPKGTIVGNSMATLPYQFPAGDKIPIPEFTRIVNIVMPIGGSQSALFRYPKEGEKVLVGMEVNSSYLMGYLPDNSDDKIYTGPKETINNKEVDTHEQILPEEMAGQFFRYKGPNDAPGESNNEKKKECYSEIGFYHEKTLWGPKEDERDNYVDKNSGNIPKLTTLKIVSTGDINQKAANHNQIKAKRFELLVNCKGSGESDKESTKEYAFSDFPGDDSAVFAGDAHIRAGNRVIIKAGDEIELRVGRSKIVINDEGIELVSRKTHSNVENTFDTTLSLSAREGIEMFGQEVKIDAGFEFNISEGYGGSIASKLGILRVDGLDIRLATMTTLNYGRKGALNVVKAIGNVATMISGAAVRDGSSKGSLGSQVPNTVLGFADKIVDFTSNSKLDEYDPKDLDKTTLKVLSIILRLCKTTATVLDAVIDSEGPERRDSLYTTVATLEWGYMITCWGVLLAAKSGGTIHESVLHLNGNTKITLDALKIESSHALDLLTSSPLAGGTTKGLLKILEDKWNDMLEYLCDIADDVIDYLNDSEDEELRSL